MDKKQAIEIAKKYSKLVSEQFKPKKIFYTDLMQGTTGIKTVILISL